MPLTERQWTTLSRELRRAVARVAPDWTDAGTHDPGVTVLELLAYALGELAHRDVGSDPEARALLRAVARDAAALAVARGGNRDDCGGGLRRVAYFPGMLLGADDFQVEQDYLRRRLNRRNRLHGAGVVSGLAVTMETGANAPAVVIAPGLAFDGEGNEIGIDTPCVLPLPAPRTQACLLVQVAYRERPCRFVPSLATGDATGDDTAATRPSRIEETFEALLGSAPAADAVAIALLRTLRGRWRVDPAFRPTIAR